ncbi:hypothetical protein [Saccharopolyspora endophytica]|uniref:Uncharacterized protein n=1 Tax=Saccharopolyspora endophytica TaxID=543886 RepID=A0ABS5DEA2_9PSEU|nr:hypothetical protein [Saccharopolyspora endophytica]MBQ0924624.1 hypothetical protein [Saccharopolyspora endophytica]
MDNDNRRVGAAFDKTLANIGGTAVGFLAAAYLGPDAAAAISGGTAPWLEELARIARRRFEKVQEAGDAASRAAGCPFEDLIEQAIGDDRKLELLTQALHAASMAEDARKIKTLGRAIARGMDDARVDEQRRIVSTLAALEPVDARVLVMMAHDDKNGWIKRPSQSGPSVGTGVLLEAEPGLDSLIDSVVARLQTLGLISDPDSARSWHGVVYKSGLKTTTFGKLCADALNEEAVMEQEADKPEDECAFDIRE